MSEAPDLSIILAVKDGKGNLPAIFEVLNAAPEGIELLLYVAGDAGPLPPARFPVTTIAAPESTLIPPLWADGIRMAHARRVALTTSQCIPAPDWAQLMRAADIDRWAGVGGAIENDPGASAANWAIFFLRYSHFAPPLKAGESEEIAADNAVYDRDACLAQDDLMADGFWEPSFHRRFREAGRAVALDPALLVVHHGLVPSASFAEQRRAHGFAYGLERGQRAGKGRALVLLAMSPLVLPLILMRISRRVGDRPHYKAKLLPSLPWLIRFAFAWASGEALGYLAALTGRKAAAHHSHSGGNHG